MAKASSIAIFLAGLTVEATVNLTEQSWWPSQKGTIKFLPVGICTSGNTAFIGIVEPAELTEPDGIFVELMGGAVCFSKESCQDKDLSMWVDIHDYVTKWCGASEEVWAALSMGFELPLSALKSLNPGWFPGMYPGHVLDGRRGIYFPTCSADLNVGRTSVIYDTTTNKTFYHHGGQNVYHAIENIHRLMPNVKDIALFGGSGGGVAAAAWAPRLAETWPAAQVRVLVDSGMHLIPGGKIFNYFYNNVSWAPGLGATPVDDPSAIVPRFDWRSVRSVADKLNMFNGRIKVAYIACKDDKIMWGDRGIIAKYVAGFDVSSVNQYQEMWTFLTTTHKCAKPGTVASYIMDCDFHHLTRTDGEYWAQTQGKGTPEHVSAELPGLPLGQWVSNFFKDKPLDANDTNRTAMWFEAHNIAKEGLVCGELLEASTDGAVGSGHVLVAVLFAALLHWLV